MTAAPTALAEQLEGIEALDGVAAQIAPVVDKVTGPAKPVLSGRWLGHAVHPLLTDVVVGTWTSATLLDVLGGKQSRTASDRLIAVGLLSAAPTILTGWSDWGDEQRRSAGIRRAGIVHAAANATGVFLMLGSFTARKRGNRGSGLVQSFAGMAAMGAGAWLGGHLSYTRGAGVVDAPVPNAATDPA
jgi:uncharacterized membrane protein